MAIPKLVVYGIPTVALLVIVGIRLDQFEKHENQVKQRTKEAATAPVPAIIATAVPGEIIQSQQLVANIDSPFVVHLSAQTSAQIQFLNVREGDRVQKGEVLVKLDPTQLQGEILADESNLAAARQRLAQAQITKQANDIGFLAQFGKDQAGLVSADADYKMAIASDAETIAAADAAVTDARAKVAAAEQAVKGAQSDLNGARATQNDNQLKYTRTLSLNKQGFNAAQDVDDAKAALDVSVASTASFQSKLESAQSALKSAQAELQASENEDEATKAKAKSDIADANAKFLQAKATLQVSSANRSQLPAYEANLAALQAGVAAAEGQLNQSKSKLAYTTLVSPIDGVVTSRLMDPGTIAPVGADILVIQELEWLYVDVNVPVEYSQSVHLGDELSFTVTGLDGTFKGIAAQIDPAADPTSRQFLLRLRVDNSARVFKPGMYADVTFTVSKTAASVTVPLEAVTQDPQGQSRVFVVNAKPAGVSRSGQSFYAIKSVPVETGVQDAKKIQIVSGVNVGDRVAFQAARTLNDNQMIVDANAAPGPAAGNAASASGQRRKP
jgi:RND family efflux transporter MFP subunit